MTATEKGVRVLRRLFGRAAAPPPGDARAGRQGGSPLVAADQVYDRDELERFVAQTTNVDREVAALVLDVYDEYLVGLGVAAVPGHEFRFYDPAAFATQPREVDPYRVARDVEALVGVDREVATEVLDAELAYLAAKGISS